MKQYDGGRVRTYPYKNPELWDWKDIGKFGRSSREWSQRAELAGKEKPEDRNEALLLAQKKKKEEDRKARSPTYSAKELAEKKKLEEDTERKIRLLTRKKLEERKEEEEAEERKVREKKKNC